MSLCVPPAAAPIFRTFVKAAISFFWKGRPRADFLPVGKVVGTRQAAATWVAELLVSGRDLEDETSPRQRLSTGKHF